MRTYIPLASASVTKLRMATQAWAGVLRAHAAVVPRLDRVVRDRAGIPLTWYDVLLELQAAPDGRLRMTELGRRVVLSRTRVSRIVDELADAGLVRREGNPADGRSSFAIITAAGRRKYAVAAPAYLRGIAAEFGDVLTSAELRTIADALHRVAERPE